MELTKATEGSLFYIYKKGTTSSLDPSVTMGIQVQGGQICVSADHSVHWWEISFLSWQVFGSFFVFQCVGQSKNVCGHKEEEDRVGVMTNSIHEAKGQSCSETVICGIEARDVSPNNHREDVVKPTRQAPHITSLINPYLVMISSGVEA